MSAPGQANGRAAGDRRQEESALCLPHLTFDYQLSSSAYESPRYCSTALGTPLDAGLKCHSGTGCMCLRACTLGWASGHDLWSACCRPSTAPDSDSTRRGTTDSDGDFAGFSTPPDILSPHRPASPEPPKHAGPSSSGTSSPSVRRYSVPPTAPPAHLRGHCTHSVLGSWVTPYL